MYATAASTMEIQLVQEIVGKWLCEERSLETLAEDGQRLGRCHVVRQVVPGPPTHNGQSPVGDGCQLDRRHCQTVGGSWTERSTAR